MYRNMPYIWGLAKKLCPFLTAQAPGGEPDAGEGSSMDWSPEQILVNSPNLIQFDIDL